MSGCQAAEREQFIENDLVVRSAWRRVIAWPRLDVWRSQCAGLLGAMVLLQLAAAAFTPLNVPYIGTLWDYLEGAAIGVMAVPTLLAVWAVFGPQPVAVRLPLTLWLATANGLALQYGAWRADGNDEGGFVYTGGFILAYVVAQVPLWPLRAVGGWRLAATPVVDGAAAASTPRDRVATKLACQFTMRALLVWTLAIALLLAVLRTLMPDKLPAMEDFLDVLPSFGSFALYLAVMGLPVVAVTWLVLVAGRRLVLRSVVLSLLLAMLLLGHRAMGLCFGEWDESETSWLEAGMIPNGVACLAVAAACGYRLQRRPRAAGREMASAGGAAMRRLSRRRLSIGAVALLAVAVIVACAAPEKLEQWQRHASIVKWRRGGFDVWFGKDGTRHALHISGASVSNDTLDEIARLNCQEQLSLDGAKIDDGQLALLAPMIDLQVLELDDCEITDEGLCQLPPLPALQKLNLSNTRVSDVGLTSLVGLPSLEWLDLEGTEVTDEGLLILASLPNLSLLDVRLTAVTATGAKRLLAARPEVELMYGASDQYLGRHLQFLGHITDLFEGMLPCIRNPTLPVRRLHVRGTMPIAGSDVVLQVTDPALAALADLTELEELDLRDTSITDRGLPSLAKLTALRRLDLRGTRVSEQAIAELSKSLPACEILRPTARHGSSHKK